MYSICSIRCCDMIVLVDHWMVSSFLVLKLGKHIRSKTINSDLYVNIEYTYQETSWNECCLYVSGWLSVVLSQVCACSGIGVIYN